MSRAVIAATVSRYHKDRKIHNEAKDHCIQKNYSIKYYQWTLIIANCKSHQQPSTIKFSA